MSVEAALKAAIAGLPDLDLPIPSARCDDGEIGVKGGSVQGSGGLDGSLKRSIADLPKTGALIDGSGQ